MRFTVIFSCISLLRSLESSSKPSQRSLSLKDHLRKLSRSKSTKDLSTFIPPDRTTFCSVHDPISSSKFSSLSPASSSPPGVSGQVHVRMSILKGNLPALDTLETTDGIIKYGKLGLSFDIEYGEQEVGFLRLVNAKCPALSHLLPEPAVDEDIGEGEMITSNAVVFPAWSSKQLPSSPEEEEITGKKATSTLNDYSLQAGMYEIRVPDGDIDKAIKLLYTILPIPPWTDIISMPANKYFILATCLHLRGYEKALVMDSGITIEPVAIRIWKEGFKVNDNNRNFDYMVVKDLTKPPKSENDEVENAYNLGMGTRPSVESLLIENDGSVETTEGSYVKFSLGSDKMLTLDRAKCPRWHRPTPREISPQEYHYKRFPVVFDDPHIFARLLGESEGALVTTDSDSINDAIKSLYHIIRKPPRSVLYTNLKHTANDYLITAICSNIHADLELFGEPRQQRARYYKTAKRKTSGVKAISPREDMTLKSNPRPTLTLSEGAKETLV